MTCVKGQVSKNGWSKYNQTGHKLHNSAMICTSTVSEKRTDDTFLNRTDQNYHLAYFFFTKRSFVPAEFQRRPRQLFDLSFWKGTELRQFICYTGQ